MEPKSEVFDVASALKEFPENEVASHLAQLHGIDRDAYLKEGLSDADFLKEYGSKTLPATVSSGASTDPMASRNDPLNTSAAGAIAGGAGSVGKLAFNRMFPNQPVPAAPPPTPEPEPYIHGGQRYKAKTGFGAGEGESVREVSDEWKRIEAEKNKPAGRGKVSSKVTGGSPDEILARAKAEEAELANQARIRAQIKMAEEAKRKAAFDAAEAQRKAIEAERKFAVPNRIGKSLPVTGATIGYNLADVNQQLKQDDPVQAAIAGAGVVGAAAPYIKKLPPKLRAIGTGLSLLAPVVNRGIDAVEEKAAGGLTGYANGKKVLAEKIAKKGEEMVKGYLHHTAIKPNPQVGTRFKTTDTGGLITPFEFDPSKYMGAKILHRPYDLSSRNQLVEEVSGHKLEKPFKTSGGQPFGRDIELQKIGIGGASNEEFNDRILDRVNAAAKEGTGQVLNIPSSMSFGSEAFSTMPISIQRDLLKQRELSPEAMAQLNAEMRNFDPKKFSKFLGFDHPEVEKQLLEGGYDLGTTPGQLRKHLAQRLGTKANQKLLDYNVEDLYHAIRDPDLRNTPPGYMGLTVMEAKPFAPAFGSGYHDAYNAGDASTYVGKGVNAPISLWMPDSYREAFARLKAEQPGGNLTNLRSQARNILGTQQSGVAQTMNQQVVDNLGRYKEAVEAGKLDPNNLDEIHKYIYGKKAEEYATGGGVQHFANGRLALAERIGKGTLDLLGKSKEEILAARKLLPKHPQQQNPELAKAVDALRTGQISQKEYLDIAARLYRPNILGKVPDKLSPEQIAVAIGPGKASKGIVGYNVELPKGATYESRLDIPGYTDTGRSVSSIELPSGKMVYGQAEHMGQSDLISDPTKGMRVALGTKEQAMTPGALEYGAPKSPFAVVKGPHLETDPDEIRRMMEFYSGDPKWRELGMNPYSHSQFFDKKTMQPAWNADEVLKYGQYVLGKEPELTHWLDPRLAVDAEKVGGVPGIKFKKGGLATLKKKK